MPRYRPNVVLTDEQVLEMRREVRATGIMKAREWGRLYGVSHVTVLHAIRGKTFRNLPDAVVEEVKFVNLGRKAALSDEVLLELHRLRSRNPLLWSYQQLAAKANVEHGTNLYPSNIKKLLDKRFGTVVRPPQPKVERVAVPRVRKPREERVERIVPRVVKPRVEIVRTQPRPVREDVARIVDLSLEQNRKRIAERLLAMRGG